MTGPDRPGGGDAPTSASVVLLWIPVGAGGHVVRHTSAWWGAAHARIARRRPRRLFHAALEVTLEGVPYVVEMAPAWGGPRRADRGVVCSGPVGLRFLGRWPLFRYEVRCWRGGIIPDRAFAVGAPTALSADPGVAAAVLDHVRRVPELTWGRAAGASRDMWNSNSVVSWLLVVSGIDPRVAVPPPGGWAPGWDAGLEVAAAAAVTRSRR